MASYAFFLTLLLTLSHVGMADTVEDNNMFWEEFELAFKQNNLPDYVQTALEHSTFEKLDKNNDGILSLDELSEFHKVIAASAASGLFGDADEVDPEHIKGLMRYPVFSIDSEMSEAERELICLFASMYADMDVDSVLSDLVEPSGKLGAAKVGQAFFQAEQVEYDFSTWSNMLESKYVPQVWSAEPSIPKECKDIDLGDRRRLQFARNSWEIHAAFFFIATVAGGADLFFIECHNPGNHWWVFQQTKTCNLQRFVSVFSSVFLVEEVTFWTLRRLGIFPDPSHISRVGPVPVEQLADIVGRATTRTREIGIQVGPPAGTGIGFPMGHMGRALSSVPVVGDPIQASGSNIYNTMSDLFGR